jgi:16S rRNA (guanine(966)-N(2))-methyltransferase RsmD
MRVTGGVWRSRRLSGPSKRQKIRPTPDAMRERCFAVLADRIVDARVLDLYAGTGAVGIEALSRGAAAAVFVESHRTAVLDSLGVGRDRADVLERPAGRALAELERSGCSFDVIWADPPFEHWADGLDALVATADAGLAADGARLCLECPTGADVAGRLPAALSIERDLVGGASRVVILRRR